MKIPDHTLRAELDNILKNIHYDPQRVMLYKYWPVAAGPQLSAVTDLKSIKDGVLKVASTSSSAKSLLLLKKKNIISKYQEKFPEMEIVDLEVLKRC